MSPRVQPAPAGGTPPLRVPATALVIRDGPPQVVTVAPDSTAHYQTVTIGRDLGSWVEVTGGLDPAPEIAPNGHRLEVGRRIRSEEHTSELQSRLHLVCRLLLE